MKNHSTRSCRNYARALSIAAAGALSRINGTAAFFQLQENNVSSLGNAYAGAAAIAEDPSGTTRPGWQSSQAPQLVVAGHLIQPKFSKTSANLSPTLGGGAISGGEGGDAGETAIVTNLYYTRQLDEQGNLKF